MNDFERQIEAATGGELCSFSVETLQVNVGLICNQKCSHCHLEASPRRTEMMKWRTMELILEVVRDMGCRLVDLTGGAPELNPNFRRFVEALHKDGRRVQVRTNLTVLLEPGMETMPAWLQEHEVQIVASLPCYIEENVRAQRGERVYEKSIQAIKRLNALGYGSDPSLSLDLVYNPGGPFLPPPQSEIEEEYRHELDSRFGITFSRLLTITNMAIGRFRTKLRQDNQLLEYARLLRKSFNPETLDKLMCRRQICIAWDGKLYDCDFNLAIGCGINDNPPDATNNIESFDPSFLRKRKIVTGEHCFGCTAGCGSSCGGALI